ncbi:MAG: PadR family transcriptional regulator [archaeon GB-1867-097]|nr:PadR family transcriptional regulator [Candidatus Culexmicrobium thermophilum]MCS7385033.1 PadR family transcriptional regulator [Candidatus Culexmicrobium thermophilum]HDO20509.1 PadR family transcriptional regulator [Candidatus Bathyarchaeota archaeon]
MHKLAYERLVRKLTKENLWLYVISVLKEKTMYGYEVKKNIKSKFNFSPSTVTVYAVLYRMLREGLIRKVNIDGVTYYTTTEKGLELFNKARRFIESMSNLLFK